MENNTDYGNYVAAVYGDVCREALTLEQADILCVCYKATLDNSPVHTDRIMEITGLTKQKTNRILNGLVKRWAIRKIAPEYYMV